MFITPKGNGKTQYKKGKKQTNKQTKHRLYVCVHGVQYVLSCGDVGRCSHLQNICGIANHWIFLTHTIQGHLQKHPANIHHHTNEKCSGSSSSPELHSLHVGLPMGLPSLLTLNLTASLSNPWQPRRSPASP